MELQKNVQNFQIYGMNSVFCYVGANVPERKLLAGRRAKNLHEKS
jgi:hypothetical protein